MAQGLAGCSGSAASPSSGAAASGGAGGARQADGGRDAASLAGSGGGGLPAAGGSTNAVHTEMPGAGGPPGVYLTSETAPGSLGACAGTTLGGILAAIRALDPTLADIRTIYIPATATGDGSFIYAYDAGVLGFDVVFKRGLGSCVGGCTENDYQYYATDGSCRPVHAGQYHTTWGTGTCLTVEGTPMWTHPAPPDPVTVCGQDNSARDLRGTYGLLGSGTRAPCSTPASNAHAVDVANLSMKVLIAQNPADLSTGTVTFWFTGDPLVDGTPLPAAFERSRFSASRTPSTLPNVCPSEAMVTAHYDFEGYQAGGVEAVDSGDASCNACKGSLSLTLSLAGNVAIP